MSISSEGKTYYTDYYLHFVGGVLKGMVVVNVFYYVYIDITNQIGEVAFTPS